MATQLFLRSQSTDLPTATQGDKPWNTDTGCVAGSLKTSRGSGVVVNSANTVAGPTSGVDIRTEWVSEPVSADVTISGAITCNVWAAENNMSANVAINFDVDVIRADGTVADIVRSARTSEVALTTRAVNNFSATPGAGVTVNKGDRLRVMLFGDDAGTMGSGFTFNVGTSGASAAADGDTYVSFTENFSFMSAPAGATIYLTDVASDVATASVDRRAWTSRGDGVESDVLSTSGGAILQWTDTAGGTVVDWFTPQLQAFTLADMIQCNMRCAQSINDYNHLRVEIARVNADGSSPAVFGDWMSDGNSGSGGVGQLPTSEEAITCWVSGDDLAFSDGHRIRVRVETDVNPQGSSRGSTCTLWYDGTSGGASGDSWIKLNQSVSEYVPGPGGEDVMPYVGGGYYS